MIGQQCCQLSATIVSHILLCAVLLAPERRRHTWLDIPFTEMCISSRFKLLAGRDLGVNIHTRCANIHGIYPTLDFSWCAHLNGQWRQSCGHRIRGRLVEWSRVYEQLNAAEPLVLCHPMSLLTKIAGFTAFGVAVRAYALGLQRRSPFTSASRVHSSCVLAQRQ